ncbi:MAG TPA: caspase family protein [Gemmatimonadaceae bacterium]|nr:caspase family protein [Gemmatimonadaceae bacterium]
MKKMFAVIGVVAAGLLTGFSGAGDRTPPRPARHISLLIGVGTYEHAGSDKWKNMHLANLRGPARDVVLMKTALRNRGFAPGENQHVIVDGGATKDAIRREFAWIASRATESQDVVVIYFSGHGSWAPDRNGDEARNGDAGDKWDEGLVPHDAANPDSPDDLVIDDEIGAWLARLRSRNVTIIIDACFSGTITRGEPDTTSASAPVARGPRPPEYVSLSSSVLDGGRALNHTVLTAASSAQKAYEKNYYGEGVSGVFTRALAAALEGAGADTRWDDVLQQIRSDVGGRQTPQLEGERGGRIFRVDAGFALPARGYAIAQREGDRVGIDVGAIHGVRKGMWYDVYPAGETRFESGRVAQIKVDSVFDASSFASVVSGTVPRSARATLSRVPPGAMDLSRLKLFVHPSAGALRDSLAALPWVRLTDAASKPMAELRRVGDAYQVIVDGHDVAPLWGDDAGGISMSATERSPRGYVGNVAALCRPLRRAFSIAALGLVRNDQPPPRSRLRVDVRVLPTSVTSFPTDTFTFDSAHVGRDYNVWVSVRVPQAAIASSKLYLTAAVAGYGSAPRVLWPVGNRTQAQLTIEQLRAPFVIGRLPDDSPEGVENIKVVVSSDPYDLRPLIRDVPDCVPTATVATRGNGKDTLAVRGWTAVSRRVELHPRRP